MRMFLDLPETRVDFGNFTKGLLRVSKFLFYQGVTRNTRSTPLLIPFSRPKILTLKSVVSTLHTYCLRASETISRAFH